MDKRQLFGDSSDDEDSSDNEAFNKVKTKTNEAAASAPESDTEAQKAASPPAEEENEGVDTEKKAEPAKDTEEEDNQVSNTGTLPAETTADEEEEEEQLPEFSKKDSVAMKLLEQTPPGQLNKAIDELKKVYPSFSDAAVKDACNRHAARNFEVVKLSTAGDKNLVLSEDNVINQSPLKRAYVSSADKKPYTVDGVTKSVTATSASCTSFFQEDLEDVRVAVRDALTRSLATKHPEGNEKSSSAGFEVFAKNDSLVVLVSSHRSALKNYWAGKWTSRWTISTPKSSPKLTGESHLLTHYFENGNVQMHSSKKHSLKLGDVSGSDVSTIGKQIVTAIEQLEDAYEYALEQKYENIGSQSLKDLRRALPVAGHKMSWNVRDHQVKRMLQRKSK